MGELKEQAEANMFESLLEIVDTMTRCLWFWDVCEDHGGGKSPFVLFLAHA